MTGLRVIIVDSSAAARTQLRRIVEADRDIWVVHEVSDVSSAPRLVRELEPDLITLDAAALAAGGLTVVERIMADRPLPLLVLVELSIGADSALVAQAIGRGALDVQVKPTPSDLQGAARLRRTIRQMARVRVVRHIPSGHHGAPALRPGIAAPAAPGERSSGGPSRLVVGLGSSAGGPAALAAILERLPADFLACIAVVQHLPIGFIEPFVDFLRTHTRLRIAVVRHVMAAAPGTVLLPADDCHLIAASSDAFTVTRDPPVCGHRPSVDVLFRSLALHHGGRAVGIILSGIGQDGCAGLQEMRAQGALTMAQDERSSAVYGMPRTAWECGAAGVALPPEELAAALLKRCSGREQRS